MAYIATVHAAVFGVTNSLTVDFACSRFPFGDEVGGELTLGGGQTARGAAAATGAAQALLGAPVPPEAGAELVEARKRVRQELPGVGSLLPSARDGAETPEQRPRVLERLLEQAMSLRFLERSLRGLRNRPPRRRRRPWHLAAERVPIHGRVDVPPVRNGFSSSPAHAVSPSATRASTAAGSGRGFGGSRIPAAHVRSETGSSSRALPQARHARRRHPERVARRSPSTLRRSLRRRKPSSAFARAASTSPACAPSQTCFSSANRESCRAPCTWRALPLRRRDAVHRTSSRAATRPCLTCRGTSRARLARHARRRPE